MILRKPSLLLFDTSLSDMVQGEERSKTARALEQLIKHQHVTVVHSSSESQYDISWLKSHGYTIIDLNARNRGLELHRLARKEMMTKTAVERKGEREMATSSEETLRSSAKEGTNPLFTTRIN